MKTRILALTLLATAFSGQAFAQSLACPAVSSNTSFSGTTLETECSVTNSTTCTEKSGVTFDSGGGVLTLPGTAGNFQSPPSTAVSANVYFAAPGDFDKDGWTDFIAADNYDKIYVMRNQTMTCGTSSCSGTTSTAPTTQTITSTWWNTLANKRPAAFRTTTNTGGTALPLKAGVSASQRMSPMAAGDFDGDGWTDFIQISSTYCPSGCSGNDVKSWPTAARLFLNTKNCHLTSQSSNFTPCGIGNLCTGQPTNGACSGGSVTSGTAYTESQLSCTATNKCPYYMPTFAAYDLLTGATDVGTTVTTTSPTTTTPGNFGPIGHPVQNIVVLDWDGDGDLDFLFGHSGGTCPSGLCGSGFSQFYSGIDVWLNSCAGSAQWNATTKSCIGHIPRFTHPADSSTTCSGTTCNNNQTLIPSTSHNTTTLAPNTQLGWDVSTDGDKRIPGFAYVDIDKDNDYDLVIGSPGCCTTNAGNRLRVFRGTSNSKYSHMLDTANPIVLSTTSTTDTYKGFKGALTAVFVADFSGDGYADIVTGSDGFAYTAAGTIGGRTQYWKNTGNASTPFGAAWPSCSAAPASCTSCTAACNPAATTLLSESAGTGGAAADLASSPPEFGDFDMGLMLDYDHDPNRTLDMVFTNGNLVNEFYIFPNRASAATVSACGTVASGTLPEPADESTVNGACITPSATFLNSTSSITYYLTNEDPENWVLACKQTSTGFVPATCCATFTNRTGRSVKWRAVLDSNSSDDATSNPCTATGTVSPTISAVSANYTYSEAQQHYRAGVVISDGVTYVGSFREPGNRGSFYALAAGDGTRYYDAATKIDAMSTRWLYTASSVGTSITRLDFTAAAASAGTLTGLLGSSASQIVAWVRSTRFGLGSTLSTLGAVMDSTPAVLTPPFRPNWYTYLTSTDKALYDTFATTYAARPTLALFAAMDGIVHAIISPASTIGTDPNAGTEAWGFIPPNVAGGMSADYITSCPSGTCSTATLSVTAYPDGSPTILDYKKSNNTIATAALIGDGAGGKSLTALDVTSTITVSGSGATASYTRTGPTPLWSQLSGGSAAGKAMSKPGVARVKIAGVEKYVVVAATGIDSAASANGKVVSGYDLETGALLWKFETSCAVTSDITIFETDDSGETGTPVVDGLADRAVFADYCGYVYKINPSQNLSGGYMGNSGYGTISLGTSNGVTRYALFTTTATGALGAGNQRPIVGAIAAKTGTDGDMLLFFGTGGIESYDPTKQNAFFAVYAKNGNIRGTSPSYTEGKILGDCTAGKCEKFYGGVVLTSDTVILQKTRDAVITGVPGGCDFGQSKVQFRNLNTLVQSDEVSSIGGSPIAASSSPLYGDANAIYFATVSGKINRIGAPRASTAGADSSAGNMNRMAGGAGGSTFDNPFTLIGWRVVL